jgi:hypothetical protein
MVPEYLKDILLVVFRLDRVVLARMERHEASTTFMPDAPTASCMGTLLANAAIVVVLALFAGAIFAMTLQDYALAGVLFLSASIVIYYRENRLVAD